LQVHNKIGNNHKLANELEDTLMKKIEKNEKNVLHLLRTAGLRKLDYKSKINPFDFTLIPEVD
jgi:hypothetical protein